MPTMLPTCVEPELYPIFHLPQLDHRLALWPTITVTASKEAVSLLLAG